MSFSNISTWLSPPPLSPPSSLWCQGWYCCYGSPLPLSLPPAHSGVRGGTVIMVVPSPSLSPQLTLVSGVVLLLWLSPPPLSPPSSLWCQGWYCCYGCPLPLSLPPAHSGVRGGTAIVVLLSPGHECHGHGTQRVKVCTMGRCRRHYTGGRHGEILDLSIVFSVVFKMDSN